MTAGRATLEGLLIEVLKGAVADVVREVVREELRTALLEIAPPAPSIDLLDVKAVLAIVPNASEVTVRNWIRSGHLAAKRIGRGYVIERSALLGFLAAPGSPAAAKPQPEVEREVERLLGKIRGPERASVPRPRGRR